MVTKALNFPQEYAGVIADAIVNGIARYLRSTAICDHYDDYYYFAGCQWRVGCNDVRLETIELIGGKFDKEALTVAVLTGKIESS